MNRYFSRIGAMSLRFYGADDGQRSNAALRTTQATTGEMPPNTTKTVSDDEMAVAYSGAAVFSNKFYVTITPAGPRIAFTEVRPGTDMPLFRTAVVLPFPDADSFSGTCRKL